MDGGSIIGGSSSSIDENVNAHNGSIDCWIVKQNSNGEMEWQTAIGGSEFEEIHSMIYMTDGSILLAGYTSSVDGEVTENSGNFDQWIIKLTSSNSANIKEKSISSFNDKLIYPNPSNGIIIIDKLDIGNKIRLNDINGREIVNQNCISEKTTINFDNYSIKGIYYLTILNEQNQIIQSEKVLFK